MRRQRAIVAAMLLSCIFLSGVCSAKDLSSRLAVGYTNQFGLSTDLPSVALRYFPNAEYGIMGSLGVDTQKDQSRFGITGKIIKIIFKEDNLNFYTAAGAGLISVQTSGVTNSGFDLVGTAGAEFFMPGLENLSFCMEVGVGITSVTNEVRFRTVGDHPLKAGMFFYF